MIQFYRIDPLVLLIRESFENPDWNGTYDTGSLVYPTFTEPALFVEQFDSDSWPLT
jgi:hypothetical protein